MIRLLPILLLGQVVIMKDDVPVARETKNLNFSGTPVTCVPYKNSVKCTITGGSGSGAPVDGGYVTFSGGATGSTNERTLTAGTNIAISTATPGQVSIAVTDLPSPITRRVLGIIPGYGSSYINNIFAFPQMTIAPISNPIMTCTSQARVTDGSSPSQRQGIACSTGTGNGALSYIDNGAASNTGASGFSLAQGPKVCARVGFTTATANQKKGRVWLGLAGTANGTTLGASATPNCSHVTWRYDNTVSTSYWYACQDTGSGGSPTCNATTVPVDTTVRTMCVDCSRSSTQCTFMADGVDVYTNGSTDRPTDTPGLNFVMEMANGSTDGGVMGMQFYGMRLEAW